MKKMRKGIDMYECDRCGEVYDCLKLVTVRGGLFGVIVDRPLAVLLLNSNEYMDVLTQYGRGIFEALICDVCKRYVLIRGGETFDEHILEFLVDMAFENITTIEDYFNVM